MQESDIAWCDYTWNPTHGCSRASAGCDNCYAEKISRQYGHTEHPWTNEHAAKNVSTKPEKLDEPYAIGPTARDAFSLEPTPIFPSVFVNSMSDLFHSAIPEPFIRQVFAHVRNCPHVIFQILTKRPARAAHLELDWPPNVWMGTSVEDERVTERIGMLADVPADVRFVSFEPLIGPVGDVDLSAIDWCIVGGESGPDADRRDMEHAWARDIRGQAERDGAAFFFKQSSARHPETGTALTVEDERFGTYVQREIREWPEPSEAVSRARAALRQGVEP